MVDRVLYLVFFFSQNNTQATEEIEKKRVLFDLSFAYREYSAKILLMNFRRKHE